MTHEAAFLKEILADPEADCPRLLFADWLDENDQRERAEFVRVQCALAGLRCTSEPLCELLNSDMPEHLQGWCMECCRIDALRRRERELLDTHRLSWAMPLPQLLRVTEWHGETRDLPWIFRCGLVESIECAAADWLAHADALTAAAPLCEVRLTTWPEFSTRASPHIKNQGRLHGRREWFVLETDLIGSLTSQVALELLHAEWPRIAFTLPPGP